MSKVIFDLNQIETEIQCDENETMETICSRYAFKIRKELKTLIFMYSGKAIDLNLSFIQTINNLDKEKKSFKVLVKSIIDTYSKGNSNYIISKQCICPTCSEIAKISFQDYKINLLCRLGHEYKLLIPKYKETQKIDQSKIICDVCKNNNKIITFQNMFHRCNTCKINICPLCVSKHAKIHNIINYDDKNFICEEHSEFYNSYCKSCQKNLCIECEKFHRNHKIETYGNIVPDKNKLKQDLEEYKTIIEKFNESIKVTINKLKQLVDNMNILYEIYEDMVNNYINSKSKRNYEIISNINEFRLNDNNFIKIMQKFIQMKEDYHQIPNLLNVYDKMVSEKLESKFESFDDIYKKYIELKSQNEFLQSQLNKDNEKSFQNFNNSNPIFNNSNSLQKNFINNVNFEFQGKNIINDNMTNMNQIMNNNMINNHNMNILNNFEMNNNMVKMQNNMNMNYNMNNNINMNNNMISNMNSTMNNNNNMNMNSSNNLNIGMKNNINNDMNLNNRGIIIHNLNFNDNFSITQIKLRPHKIGIKNINNCSCMNVSLYILSNITKLSNKILDIYFQNLLNFQQHPLTFAFANLLFEIKTTTQQYISSTTFITTLETLNPSFKNNPNANPKDLISFIIQRIHQELKPPKIQQIGLGQNNFIQEEIESRNEALVLNKFLNELQNYDTTIISEPFHGIKRIINKCLCCCIIKYAFKTFNIIDFNLKKVKDDKQAILGEYYPKDYIINLMDGFMSDFEQEKFTGKNMIYCNNCRQLTEQIEQKDIYHMPSILIIILNRGKNNQEFSEFFRIDELLNFANESFFCNPLERKKKYFLCGIISYIGKGLNNGYFICFWRNSINEKFYRYDDISVKEVSVEEALKTKISNKNEESVIPYILLYSLKK